MGSRLGFGSGIYDRSLPNFPKSKKIGLAFSGQLNKRGLPISEFDYKLDAVVTEEDILYFNEDSKLRIMFLGDIVGRAAREKVVRRVTPY